MAKLYRVCEVPIFEEESILRDYVICRHPCPRYVSPQDFIISALNDAFWDASPDCKKLQEVQDAIWSSCQSSCSASALQEKQFEMIAPTVSKTLPNNLQLIWTLTRRNLDNNAFDPAPFWIRLVVSCLDRLVASIVNALRRLTSRYPSTAD